VAAAAQEGRRGGEVFRLKLLRIRAWGSDVYPDLDYEADVLDDIVKWNYPCLDVAHQVPVTFEAIMRELETVDDHRP
jgi:hypothetical protein